MQGASSLSIGCMKLEGEHEIKLGAWEEDPMLRALVMEPESMESDAVLGNQGSGKPRKLRSGSRRQMG